VRPLTTYLSILIYLSLWCLFGAALALLGRVLCGGRVVRTEDGGVSPEGLEPPGQSPLAGWAGVAMVLSLLVAAWAIVPRPDATALVGVGVPLVVLLILLLHVSRRDAGSGPGRRG